MVSYADASQSNIMPSSDFDLYPSHEEPYTSLLAHGHYPAPAPAFQYTTFDAQPNIQAFSAPHPNMYAFKQNYLPYSPAASPASGSQSFEVCPPHLSTASESTQSAQSTSSSAAGSPSMGQQFHEPWSVLGQGLGLAGDAFATCGFEYEGIVAAEKISGCVDPTLIQPFQEALPYGGSPYPDFPTPSLQFQNFVEQPPSPAPSNTSSHNVADSRRFKRSSSQSPYLHQQAYQPYPAYSAARRPSAASVQSRQSTSGRSNSFELDEESREKGMCPIEGCGRVFKDLKAHMLTHQSERPEKCPITTCEYHLKGFARKYDKNRHTLTHYKGTMVCGFCPGSGSAAEKSFNRADVFKRHLTSVHGVEQTPPNSRKKSPTTKKAYTGTSTAGTCSTCSVTFANAQEFYEHLDDCVLRVVQQADPAEAINQKLLSSVADDEDVKETMDRHHLPNEVPEYTGNYDEDEEEEDSRKKRKNYPVSWGCPTERMKMKKRVLCVYDGPRRLWKDDMMLDHEFEVRMKLPGGDGKQWVTDLDVQTLKRAEALHSMPEEDKGEPRWDNVIGGAPMQFDAGELAI
ncbi:Zinc finger C2H2-type/integrase DNA-binding protein [Neofusicoccum parvum]|uniref:Zinc finger C2H2-type/integrase DNA-binding protein n=1 Tax=Neofusicoccum parvum TaxID=310453 RepID=A0ACB5RW57_9PEZI|nr:Zinc finger C2H2-type/integrase DNA-binding protein [Neofusicoccum parvum]GME37999.1 Zinc finger C2H2-type/integrase DNA-binding protein [Neofusicoccum parvum]